MDMIPELLLPQALLCSSRSVKRTLSPAQPWLWLGQQWFHVALPTVKYIFLAIWRLLCLQRLARFCCSHSLKATCCSQSMPGELSFQQRYGSASIFSGLRYTRWLRADKSPQARWQEAHICHADSKVINVSLVFWKLNWNNVFLLF